MQKGRKTTKRNTMVDKILQRKLKIEQQEHHGGELNDPECFQTGIEI